MGFIADEPLNSNKTEWDQYEAITLCAEIEGFCPQYGCHVALTGGTLYKDGPRKDLDILFYRIRQKPEIDIDGLFEALSKVGIMAQGTNLYTWCVKAKKGERRIDILFPEASGEEYPEKDSA